MSNELRRRTLSAVELVGELIRWTQASTHLGAYISFDPQRAVDAASASDERRRRDRARGALDGVPFSVKDLLTTHDHPTTAQTRVPDPIGRMREDATAVARLRAADGLVMDKTTLLEYACRRQDQETG